MPAPHDPATTTTRATATGRTTAPPNTAWTDIPLPPEPPDGTRNGHRTRSPADEQPHDQAAERAVLGAALLAPDIIPELAAILRDDDFHHPAHTTIWHAISDQYAAGRPVDVLTLGAQIGTHRALQGLGGPLYISNLAADPSVLPASATWHAGIVAARADERRVLALATRLTQTVHSGAGTDTVPELLARHLGDRNVAVRERPSIPTVDELLAGDEAEHDWLVPGLLERGDRMILTGPEGGGKSTFCRQFAVMVAAGIHPFAGEPIEPVSVLILDLENSRRQTRREIRPLRQRVGRQLDPNRLHVEVRIQGVDLSQPTDVAWLTAAVEHLRPDLLVTGPVYKMANGDPNEEKSAKPVAMAIDKLRADHDLAVLLEAHSAKAPAGQKRRPKEPFGWSGWMRWPEFGVHLDKDGTITHWRGQREQRDWPELLLRGGSGWPWTPARSEPEQRWARIHQCLSLAGRRLPNREIARRTGIPESTVRTLLTANSRRFAALLDHLGAADDE